MADPLAVPVADIASLSFEAALRELEEIVRKLEGGQVALEESIAIYGRGVALKRHCEAKLETARAKVEEVVAGPGGNVETRPLDVG